jgi:hypothetical protein
MFKVTITMLKWDFIMIIWYSKITWWIKVMGRIRIETIRYKRPHKAQLIKTKQTFLKKYSQVKLPTHKCHIATLVWMRRLIEVQLLLNCLQRGLSNINVKLSEIWGSSKDSPPNSEPALTISLSFKIIDAPFDIQWPQMIFLLGHG